jgi:hypothetical protein
MTDYFPARAAGKVRRRIALIALATGIGALAIIGTAQAKQQCWAEAAKGGYWSWRMIDGRKCWYEGKPMLSKSLLEWPAESAAQADAKSEPASAAPESHGDPMDAQASVRPGDATTFDALWRDRIEGSRR